MNGLVQVASASGQHGDNARPILKREGTVYVEAEGDREVHHALGNPGVLPPHSVRYGAFGVSRCLVNGLTDRGEMVLTVTPAACFSRRPSLWSLVGTMTGVLLPDLSRTSVGSSFSAGDFGSALAGEQVARSAG